MYYYIYLDSERNVVRNHSKIQNTIATISAGLQPSKAFFHKDACATGTVNRITWTLCNSQTALSPVELREKALKFIKSDLMIKLSKCMQDLTFEHQIGMRYLENSLYDGKMFPDGQANSLLQFFRNACTVLAENLQFKFCAYADYLRKCMILFCFGQCFI